MLLAFGAGPSYDFCLVFKADFALSPSVDAAGISASESARGGLQQGRNPA
jgi:hypothetical protein